MKTEELVSKINKGELDVRFAELYGEPFVSEQRKRYIDAINDFSELFGNDRDVRLFSVPGRSEISGNHTDHNRGCVIAAAVNLDIIAVASANDKDTVTVKSKGFPADTVSCFPDSPEKALFYTSGSLLSGICAGFLKRGYKVHGYDAYTTSDVLKGSGISSSAAFEVMVGTIMNYLYNDNVISAPEIAQIAQFSENVYFGKPSGLMDQTACAVGGFSFIDFENAEGNLGIATSILEHLAVKLPVSRLQRDLTDSTVLRNVGVPFGHIVIAIQSSLKGLRKLLLNEPAIYRDLDNCWSVVAEAIQTILRREAYPHPYEALKALTRTNQAITESSIKEFIEELNVSEDIKKELRAITPHTYTGL